MSVKSAALNMAADVLQTPPPLPPSPPSPPIPPLCANVTTLMLIQLLKTNTCAKYTCANIHAQNTHVQTRMYQIHM